MSIDPSLQWLLAGSMIVYLIVMYAIGWVAKSRIGNVDDYLVAGRRLPLSLAWMTILATWFGAGTMLTVADEVRSEGLVKAALDPWGAGVCLILAGLFVAGPMWRMKLLTVPDFFRRKFGPVAERISALILVPSYFGWIAAQFTALAEVLHLFFAIPVPLGIALVALIGTGYTLMGGMWSVTLTDAVQVLLLLGGLIVLVVVMATELGAGHPLDGFARITGETDPGMLVIIPASDLTAFAGWMSVFLIGALGNLPGQDLMQRVFAADSERTARRACWIAGILYLLFGAIPLTLALGGRLLFAHSVTSSIVPALAQAFLHPVVAVVFVVALLSAILSTIDSAILSPASVLAVNVIGTWNPAIDPLKCNRFAVVLVAGLSLLLAYSGESAYSLLEEAYSLTLVGLFVPMMLGLYSVPKSPYSANVSMLMGTLIWLVHFIAGWESFLGPAPGIGDWNLPISLTATFCALATYWVFEPPWTIAWKRDAATPGNQSDVP